MNYSEMSDDAIARGVVMAMGGKEMSDGVFLCENKRYDICSPKSSFNFDPCNSWADAGPIITENQISIIFDADSVIEPPAHWVMCRHVSDKGDITEHYGRPDSPLRTAMIVFLMMQEQK